MIFAEINTEGHGVDRDPFCPAAGHNALRAVLNFIIR
jgi:hypothetical protein